MRAPGTEIKSPGLVANTFTCEAIGPARVHFYTHSAEWAEKEPEEGGVHRCGRIPSPCRLHSQIEPFRTMPWDAGRLGHGFSSARESHVPFDAHELGDG